MNHESASDIPSADERRHEQARIRREYPDLYYYVAGVALVIALMLVGYILFPDRNGYLTNLFTEAVSVAVTLFVLNRMAEARERRRYKQDLIYRMGSKINHEALRAVEELHWQGWLEDGSLRGVNLSGANLARANLSFGKTTEVLEIYPTPSEYFGISTISTVETIRADLDRVNLVGANLKRADLGGANLKEAKLISANLEGGHLDGANLERANLSHANLKGVGMSNANLQGASLLGAKLEAADLWRDDFEGADLRGAILPNGDTWHPGYDMTIFTDPPYDEDEEWDDWEDDEEPADAPLDDNERSDT